MTPVNPFILKNKEKMINFLDELSVSASQHLCCFFCLFASKTHSKIRFNGSECAIVLLSIVNRKKPVVEAYACAKLFFIFGKAKMIKEAC